jgi:hypothetical protein
MAKAIFQGDIARRHFEQMDYYISCGFNLLVFGVGSKRDAINNFAKNRIGARMPKLIVNGYHVGTTIKSVLNNLINFINHVVLIRAKNEKKPTLQSE